MCQIERLENREENGGNTPDRYRARATWNSIKMHIYGFLQSTKGLKSPFHFEDGGYEIDSATLLLDFKSAFLDLMTALLGTKIPSNFLPEAFNKLEVDQRFGSVLTY